MKKKGFTLIELLAVIVILAIIALIATPIVMNIIGNSKKGAAERSAENYLRAVDTAIASERLDGPVTDGKYEVDANGDLILQSDNTIKIEVDINGTLPEEGTIVVIVNGLVDKTQVIIVVGDYTVKENEEGKLEASKNEADSNNSVTVYRFSSKAVNIGDEIDPTDTAKFTTDPTTLGRNAYLKHVLDKDNKVVESYACAVFNDEEICIQGGSPDYFGYDETSANHTGNAFVLKGLEDEGFSCFFDREIDRAYSCSKSSSVAFMAYIVGGVRATEYEQVKYDTYDYTIDHSCEVYSDGRSSCSSI